MRCSVEVELLKGFVIRCEIMNGHPGPHMNGGTRGTVPGNITWEWRAAACAGYFTCRNVPGQHAKCCPLYGMERK